MSSSPVDPRAPKCKTCQHILHSFAHVELICFINDCPHKLLCFYDRHMISFPYLPKTKLHGAIVCRECPDHGRGGHITPSLVVRIEAELCIVQLGYGAQWENVD